MNQYLKSQIENMKVMTTAFKNACHLAVMQNDGQIDKQEEKAIKKIDAATQKFLKELDSVLKG